jgi:peptide/nickel transport system ATP-binding protein
MTSLDPVYRVGRQIEETLRVHDKRLSRRAAEARAVELLELVGIPNAANRVRSYPHEFSGGMRQRVVIAIAMANQPDVIIADEPTTALDVTVQAQILEVLDTALEETGAAMVLITHDLGVVAGVADRVLVMYAGKPVEIGSVEDIYYEPRMPYTLGLLGSLPRLDSTGRERLTPIIGSPPSLVNMPPGCPFAPRCPLHIPECDAGEPPLFEVGRGHTAACIRTEIVEKAHGDATFVFEETSADTLLAGEPSPLEEDIPGADRGVGPSPEVEGEIAPDHAAGETGSVVSPKGTNSGPRPRPTAPLHRWATASRSCRCAAWRSTSRSRAAAWSGAPSAPCAPWTASTWTSTPARCSAWSASPAAASRRRGGRSSTCSRPPAAR